MKTCTKCSEEKSLDCFAVARAKPSGRKSQCKSCVNAEGRVKHAANPEKELARSRARYAANPEASWAATKRWEAANAEQNKAARYARQVRNATSAQRATKKWVARNREHVNAYARQSRVEHPLKCVAREAVKLATRKGLLVRPSSCRQCLKEGAPHGHHFDYERPFDVLWLCHKCHMAEHRRLDSKQLLPPSLYSMQAHG